MDGPSEHGPLTCPRGPLCRVSDNNLSEITEEDPEEPDLLHMPPTMRPGSWAVGMLKELRERGDIKEAFNSSLEKWVVWGCWEGWNGIIECYSLSIGHDTLPSGM